MHPRYIKHKVFENKKICDNIYKLTINGSYDGIPGQFYMIRSWKSEPFLSRPISINYRDNNCITFLYEVKGEGTRLFSNLKPNDEVELLGPLGNGFDIENIYGKVAIVSGGMGIAPMYYVIKSLKKMNKSTIDLYAGFRENKYLVDELEKYTNKIYIASNSGKWGYKGFITDIFEARQYDLVLCCGPEIMMKKVVDLCNKLNIPVLISLEKHMACGVGACLGCTCKTTNGNMRVCKEGPVFSGREVILDA